MDSQQSRAILKEKFGSGFRPAGCPDTSCHMPPHLSMMEALAQSTCCCGIHSPPAMRIISAAIDRGESDRALSPEHQRKAYCRVLGLLDFRLDP